LHVFYASLCSEAVALSQGIVLEHNEPTFTSLCQNCFYVLEKVPYFPGKPWKSGEF